MTQVVEGLHCSYQLDAAHSLCDVLEESKADSGAFHDALVCQHNKNGYYYYYYFSIMILIAGAFHDAVAQRSSEKKAGKAHDMQDDAGVSATMLDKLFPTEAMTAAASWHALHLSLWKLVIASLKPTKLALCHFAGNPPTKTSEARSQKVRI